jgi:anaerobic selenocysteine-containing dehydrogenase
MKRVVHAACPHDCPDACGVRIEVEDGRAVKLQGDPSHPVTRGFLCAKVAKYLDRVYSPERVLHPLRRVAPKGGGRRDAADFRRISWEEAETEIAERFRTIGAQFGPEAILPYSYGGTLGVLNNASMDRRFFHRLGASQLDRTICSSAGGDALVSVYGRKIGTEPEQFRHSKYIVAWGANIHGGNVHLWPFIAEARRQGARLVVIDPYRTRTARAADWYIPINPGTDVALALGLMHVIVAEGLHDRDYLAAHTIGFDALQERLPQYPPERVSAWTGVPADDIRRLAREYATQRPAAIRVNYGVQRCQNGGMAVRAIAMLPALTGSWREVGGGLQLSTSGAFPLRRPRLERPELMAQGPLGRPARVVNMSRLGQALATLDDPPVKAVFVYNSNPAAVAPNHNEVVKGLLRPDLFTVVHEQFLTDTTDYADIVLPATTFFEHKELQTAYGHYYLQVSQPAIAPLGEARSNVELFRALAQRMGFEEDAFAQSVDEMIDEALDRDHPFLAGIDRERLEREGYVRLNLPEGAGGAFLPFADPAVRCATASGKIELYSEALAAAGLDPVASFVPPAESRHAPAARTYPLELLGRKCDNYLNSTFANVGEMQKLESPARLEISAADAEARGIRDGDAVRVYNDRGAVTLTAHVNGSVQAGVVAARLNWAKLSTGGVNVNALTSEILTDIGRGATLYSCLVEVEPLARDSARSVRANAQSRSQ